LPQVVIDTQEALATIHDNLIKVKDISYSYDPLLPPEFNTLDVLVPGVGYWVNMENIDILIYPQNGTSREFFLPKSYFWKPVIYTNSTIAYGHAFMNGEPATGTIAAFVGDECRSVIDLNQGCFSLVINGEIPESASFKLFTDDAVYDSQMSISTDPGYDVAGLHIDFNSSQIIIPTSLKMIYPNPFNPLTSIAFSLQSNDIVTIDAYNVKGQKVDRIIQAEYQQGEHSVSWNAENLASGVYYISFRTTNHQEISKVILMK
jgi:hypothetical protein